MRFKFNNSKITGILSILPDKSISYNDELGNYNFSEKQSLKLAKIMGYDKHRIFNDDVVVSDLAVFGIEYLIKEKKIDPVDIDALILMTQTPDHFLPPTSNIIQGRLGLKEDMICLDINQGCAGYEIGLLQSFMLLQQESVNKVVMITADVLSRKVSKNDRNSWPLSGDAASISIIENGNSTCEIYQNLMMNGKGAYVLQIPAGGLKMPSSHETSMMVEDESGNMRSQDHLLMQGDAVFNFVQTEVPPLIDDLMEFSGMEKENIDFFLFHQPNRFMLEKLADKMEVPREKMPNNIVENFGNSSGSTVPVNICFNLGDKLKETVHKVCLAGFGVGLTWSSILLELGELKFCEIIDYKND